jgi:hypothetical protein
LQERDKPEIQWRLVPGNQVNFRFSIVRLFVLTDRTFTLLTWHSGHEGGFFSDLPRQVLALTRKNMVLAYRNRTATFLRIFSSFFFILLIFLVNEALKGRFAKDPYYKDFPDPPREIIDGIPACSSGANCITFAYTPAPGPQFRPSSTYASLSEFTTSVGNCGSPLDCAEMFRVHRVVRGIMTGNMINGLSVPIPTSAVLGFRTQMEMDGYLFNNTNVVQGCYIFSAPSDRTVTFVLQMNSTAQGSRGEFLRPYLTIALPMQVQAHRAIGQLINPGLKLEIAKKLFAHPAFDVSSFEGVIAPLFLLGCELCLIFTLLYDIVYARV